MYTQRAFLGFLNGIGNLDKSTDIIFYSPWLPFYRIIVSYFSIYLITNNTLQSADSNT